MQLQVKDCWQPQEREHTIPKTLQRDHSPADILILDI